MKEILNQFREVARSPEEWVRQWKARTGKKVIGCFPMYVPEEMIEAAGMLPFNLPGSDRALDRAYDHFYSYNCHPSMGNMDQALKGEFDFLDGVVFAQVCEESKRFATAWPVHDSQRWFYSIMYPARWDTPLARSYLAKELSRFRRDLAEFSGHEITDEALSDAIRLHNRVRLLLKELYDRRRAQPASFPLVEVEVVVNSALLMPKADYIEAIRQYLDYNRTAATDHIRARLVVVGNPCEDLEPGMAQALDRIGVAVVDDELSWGGRYFATPVPEDIDDPIEALAEAQWNTPNCPVKERISVAHHYEARTWAEYVVELVRGSSAHGVICIVPKWCEVYPYDFVELRERLEANGTPILRLEADHSGAAGTMETRIEAFVEMIEMEGL